MAYKSLILKVLKNESSPKNAQKTIKKAVQKNSITHTHQEYKLYRTTSRRTSPLKCGLCIPA
jgi:hypothetical protein